MTQKVSIAFNTPFLVRTQEDKDRFMAVCSRVGLHFGKTGPINFLVDMVNCESDLVTVRDVDFMAGVVSVSNMTVPFQQGITQEYNGVDYNFVDDHLAVNFVNREKDTAFTVLVHRTAVFRAPVSGELSGRLFWSFFFPIKMGLGLTATLYLDHRNGTVAGQMPFIQIFPDLEMNVTLTNTEVRMRTKT